ncbi:nuclease [Dipsacomyces acuminosporus]|nr:nuclease [Dipsacomyces acuminosporus]
MTLQNSVILHFPELGLNDDWIDGGIKKKTHHQGSFLAVLTRSDRFKIRRKNQSDASTTWKGDLIPEYCSCTFEVTWIANDPIYITASADADADDTAGGQNVTIGTKSATDRSNEDEERRGAPAKDVVSQDSQYGASETWSAKAIRLFPDIKERTMGSADSMAAGNKDMCKGGELTGVKLLALTPEKRCAGIIERRDKLLEQPSLEPYATNSSRSVGLVSINSIMIAIMRFLISYITTALLGTSLVLGLSANKDHSKNKHGGKNDKVSCDLTDNEFLKYGNPGPVNDFLLRQRYATSYNRALRNPNWAAEHLTKENLKGTASRTDTFIEDQAIPAQFRALLKDYYKSGYDRGHQVPAADAKASLQSMNETFYLTNISPQVGAGFNRNYWAYFEQFVRDLTNQFDDVYCVTGPLYLPYQENGKWYVKYEVIGNPPNVAVPTHFYKVILTKNKSEAGFYLGGFVMPNKAIENSKPLTDFSQQVDYIEKAAGLQFFDKVDRSNTKPLCEKAACQVKA